MARVRAGIGGITAATLLALAAAGEPALAAPLDPALQAQLLQIYDRYNKAILAGQFEQAMAQRSRSVRSQWDKPSERAEYLAMARTVVPDSVEVAHTNLSKDGQSASILVIARKAPPKTRGTQGGPADAPLVEEITLSFVKDAGAWAFDDQLLGLDPTKIKACANPAFEPIDAYDQDQSTSMGGPIVRVAFEADHTLVVVRVLDEENCVFLPPRAALAKAGVDPAQLVPYAILSVDGFPHKSDKQKVWADHASVSDE